MLLETNTTSGEFELEFEYEGDMEEDDPQLIGYETSYYPTDFTLKGYYDKWQSQQLIVPDFQRNYVWDQTRASKLIESFLLGLPVPGVFLYRKRQNKKLLVVDGQQRIFSVIRYFEGDFNGKPFVLRKVNEKFEGKTYNQLDQVDRNQLDDSVLRAIVIQQLDPQDDSSIYYIFERLNTGAVSLNPMEIRKCVYFGNFFRLLEQLNADPNWRLIIGNPNPDKRLKDIELVLRCLAMYEQRQNYHKPVKAFLNNFMSSKTNASEDELKTLGSWFEQACDATIKMFGEKPFHLRGRLNVAAMDTLIPLAIDMQKVNNPAEAVKKYSLLKENNEFIEKTSIGSADTETVRKRYALVQRFMVETPLKHLQPATAT